MNVLSKILSYIFPSISTRAYKVVDTPRHNQMWRVGGLSSAYKDIKQAHRKITAKARDLEQNNPYIKGFVRKFRISVIGEGMYPKAKVIKADGSGLDTELNRRIEALWYEWSEKAGIGGENFSTLQHVVAWHYLVDGGCLVRRVVKPEQALALEVIEYDQLDESKDNDKDIKNGIVFDKYNSPVGYWIKVAHPSEGESGSVFVPAKDILHIYEKERATQVRGICYFASVINEIYDTLEFQDATMIAARLATAFGIFIHTEYPEDYIPSTQNTGEVYDYVQPGAIHYLRPGERVESVVPTHPATTYEQFIRARLRGTAAGIGCAYETLSADYSQSSYSSTRQALLLERALYRYASNKIDELLNIPVYRWFIETMYQFGVLDLPDFERRKAEYFNVRFSRPRQEWIDPIKEAQAIETRLRNNIDTITEIIEQEGRDFDDVVLTRAAEKARLKELGLEV